MKSGARSAGFTIVETMIVMAVTGVLFISIVLAMNGRTGRVQFSDAINDIRLALQQQVSEVQSGHYPSTGNFICTVEGGKPHFAPASGALNQGTNRDCIYLGKAIQFAVDDAKDGATVNLFSLAGTKHTPSGQEVSTLAESQATVIPSITESLTLRYGLTVKWMRYRISSSPTPVNIGAFALVTSFPKGIAGGAQLVSGAQQLNIVPISNTALNISTADMITRVNQNLPKLPATPVNPDGGIQICFDSGTTARQSGIITIGGSTGNTQVTLNIKSVSC